MNQSLPGPSNASNVGSAPSSDTNANPSSQRQSAQHQRNDSAVDIQQSDHLQPSTALGRKPHQQYLTPVPLHQNSSRDEDPIITPESEHAGHSPTAPFIRPRSAQRVSRGQVSDSPSPNFEDAQQTHESRYPVTHHVDEINELPADEIAPIPAMPSRSERRRSRDGLVAPLNMHSVDNAPRHSEEIVSPTSPVRSRTPNFSRPSGSTAPPIQAPIPTHPTTVNPASKLPATAHTAGNFEPVAVEQPLRTKTSGGKGQRQSLRNAFKGIRGASDAIRGAVNEGIAHSVHDTAEEEKMRALRQQGMTDWRGSGLNERVPVGMKNTFSGRREKRSSFSNEPGVHGSEGPHGLHPLDEVESLRDEQSIRNERIH